MSKRYDILVTGGAGFIGSALCRNIIKNSNNNLIILDKLTYASNYKSIEDIIENKNVSFYQGSIGNKKIVSEILTKFNPQYVFNLAAETHVDNSISSPEPFIKTNILDNFYFIDNLLKYYKNLVGLESKKFKFLQISTDEVYGDIDFNQQPIKETAAYKPSSPYSASKAAGDHLIKAYHRTYGFPGFISNCSNNYGPYQNDEKFIPIIIKNLLNNKKIPVYGSGKQIREWIYIDDHCDALLKLIEFGVPGENYNIGTGIELTNIDLIKNILLQLNNLSLVNSLNVNDHISFVTDRLGHDKRYAINSSKTRDLCNWSPKVTLSDGLNKTIDYFLNINN